jgi:flagellar basal body-associated protein FliL
LKQKKQIKKLKMRFIVILLVAIFAVFAVQAHNIQQNNPAAPEPDSGEDKPAPVGKCCDD